MYNYATVNKWTYPLPITRNFKQNTVAVFTAKFTPEQREKQFYILFDSRIEKLAQQKKAKQKKPKKSKKSKKARRHKRRKKRSISIKKLYTLKRVDKTHYAPNKFWTLSRVSKMGNSRKSNMEAMKIKKNEQFWITTASLGYSCFLK